VITLSIVSHSQIDLILKLLQDLDKYCFNTAIELVLTLNIDENIPFPLENLAFPVFLIRNPVPQGFAANQNQAFQKARGDYFCVVNPDIRLTENPFPVLLECLDGEAVGVVSPLVVNEKGSMEDCARRFPTPLIILFKLFGQCRGIDYRVGNKTVYPDWVPGMFMVIPRNVFQLLNGFDERFFLYYEDVDLCARLRLLGFEVALCPHAKVIHSAHRTSHTNFKYFKWHLGSMARYFFSPVFLKIFFNKFKAYLAHFCR
jgi:N-acetylglucosaminyl-diphospho-decaprenol L-rhamnosyltransferase